MIGSAPVASDLIVALGRMEYRGYDSAGVALSGGTANGLVVRKVVGQANGLVGALGEAAALGRTGIAHTRWATHGRPEARNAHPMVWDGIAVVHNGIVENHAALREEMLALGHDFASDTDSEVIPHLIAVCRRGGAAPMDAMRAACGRLDGAYAVAVVLEDEPDRILVARKGSPVVVARGPWGVVAVASDPTSLGGFCAEYTALEDGELAELTPHVVRVFGADGGPRDDREWRPVGDDYADVAIGTHRHHTRREVSEQPEAVRRTAAALAGRVLPEAVAAAERIAIVACGSSLYAATAMRGAFEQLASIPCDIEIASEFRYREAPLSRGLVAVLVSQSGETADTMASLEMFRERGVPTVAVVNVTDSSIARGSDLVWPTEAGREIGVAATKTFTSQMAALMRLGLALAVARGADPVRIAAWERGLAEAPAVLAAAEEQEPRFAAVAARIAAEQEGLFIGRGWGAAIAAEAALKLKELSYIRAEAYAAGELKHGPIALVREGSPVVVHAPSDALLGKTVSNAQEVRARGAWVVAITDPEGAAHAAEAADEIIVLAGLGAAAPFAHAVAAQLIAYHAALAMGRDVDRPRNLAKSVTVE